MSQEKHFKKEVIICENCPRVILQDKWSLDLKHDNLDKRVSVELWGIERIGHSLLISFIV